MKNSILTITLILLSLFLTSCGSTKKVPEINEPEINEPVVDTEEDKKEFSDACILSFAEYQPLFESKNYEAAYTPWLYCFETCPTMSLNLYNDGEHIVKYRYENTTGVAKEHAKSLIEKIFKLRFENYPDYKPAKAYSRHAMFMKETGASEEIVFNYLQQAYNIKPESLGIKAIFQYFDGIILRNKDTNVQAIFDMYDNLQDVVGAKILAISKTLDEIKTKEAAGEALTSRQIYLKQAHATNLKSLGLIEPVLNQKLKPFETCDRLIPLYEADFETNKTNIQWLKRSINRLNHKGCTETILYDKLIESYVDQNPDGDSACKYGTLLLKRGEETKAFTYFEKCIDLETDSYKKAKTLYSLAQIMAKKGKKDKARSYAYKALKERPNYGKPYLLIAHLYATSVTACGEGDTFRQRMVYQAALIKAKKAKAVDPSISSYATRAINSYKSKAPTNKDVFNKGLTSGDPYKIGCWINETIQIP